MESPLSYALLAGLVLAWSWPARSASVAPPFPDAGGLYSGLALPDNNLDAGSAGILNLNVLPTGVFTGTANVTGRRHTVRGRFDRVTADFEQWIRDGIAINMDGTREPFFIRVVAHLDPSAHEITGRIDRGTRSVISSGTSAGSTFTLSGAPPDPALGDALAGNRETSFIDPPDPSASGGQEIPGDGFAVIKVAKTKRRAARLAGKLPDGVAYAAGTPLKGTRYAVLTPLYTLRKSFRTVNGSVRIFDFRGATYGYGQVTPTPGSLPSILAALRWHKSPTIGEIRAGNYYQNGIRADVNIDARYYPPVVREGLVPIGLGAYRENARITLQRGNLADSIQAAVTIGSRGVKFERMLSVTAGNPAANPYRIKVRFNAFIGTFSGSFEHPGTGKKTSFSGAFRPKVGSTPGEGRGAFRGSLPQARLDSGDRLESGSVRITVQ